MEGPFILGTAQLGMPYGIANTNGKPSNEVAVELIRTALDNGIEEFDTAQGYGASESVLGDVLKKLTKNDTTRIISKPHPRLNHTDRVEMRRGLETSLKRLKRTQLYGYMLHREEYLDSWNDGLGEILSGFCKQGAVEKIGVSLYTPERARQALHTDGISFIQVPFNLFDHRFKKAGIFKLAKKLQKSVYIRSIYLQGLFWLPPEKVPQKMEIAKPALKKLNQMKNEFGRNILELAIGYIRYVAPEAKILFGAETAQQVIENTTYAKATINKDIADRIELAFANLHARITDPTRWNE